jgi:arylsulfatase A-like enzyme
MQRSGGDDQGRYVRLGSQARDEPIAHAFLPDMRSKITFVLVASFACLSSAQPQRPNILFIMTDDHAAHAISAYGSKVNVTPNIDRIAREGALLRNVFATNAICTPSRAAILTGQYSHLNGVTMFNRFDSSRVTVAQLLQRRGYHTAMIGKWHLGSDPTGFDQWEIFPGQGSYMDPVLYTARSETTYKGYATDIVTDLGLSFLRDRPRDKPFFLMLHHKAPHRHWQPDSAHAAQFAGRWIPEPPTLWDDYTTRTDALRENEQLIAKHLSRSDLKLIPPPGLSAQETNRWLAAFPDTVTIERDGATVTLTGDELTRWKYQRYMQDYLATVQSVDDNIGRVLKYLDDSGLARNTIVMYTSDQGFFLGDHGMYDKRFMYEESLRMPLVMRWPGAIRPGSTIEQIVLNVDFAPTLLEAAGAEPPSDMHGRSFVSILRGRAPSSWRTSMYYRYYHDPGHHNTRQHYGVRTLTHKLIYFWTKDQWELFDLRKDPFELHNLYGQPGHAQITATLKAELARLKRELGDDDQLANIQYPGGVDGTVRELRSRAP